MLKKQGIDTYLASNGRESIQYIKKQKFDLVFMDITMPDMDGYETTRKIREITLNTPIVACTAHAFDQDRDKAEKAGMNDFIRKPYKYEEVFCVLKRWLPS